MKAKPHGQGTLPPDSARLSLVKAPGGSFAGAALGISTSIYSGTQPTSLYFDSEITGTITPLGQGIPVSGGNIAPIVVLTATPPSGFTTTNFNFDASGSFDPDGSIANFDWNFGDNTFSTGPTVNHTFVNGGTYTVQVTATDSKGALEVTGTQGTVTKTLSVSMP